MHNPKDTRQKGGRFKKSGAIKSMTTDTSRVLRIIKEQEAAKIALFKSREKFESIFNKSPIGIQLIDPKGKILDINPACLKMIGSKSIKEWKNYNFFNDKNIPLKIRKAVAKKRGVRYEINYPLKKLHLTRNFDVQISVLKPKNNPTIGFLVQVQDITKQKKFENELRTAKDNLESNVKLRTHELTKSNADLRKTIKLLELSKMEILNQKTKLEDSERRYKKLFFLSPEPYIVISDEKLANVNRASARLFGTKSSKDLIGKHVMDLIPDDQKSTVYACMRRVFRDNKDLLTELRIKRNDGQELIIELRSAPIEYKGKPAVLGIIRDVTTRKQDERLLRANNWLFALHNRNESLSEYVRLISDQLKVWGGTKYAGIRLFGKLAGTGYNSGFPPSYWARLADHETPECACQLVAAKISGQENPPELTSGGSYFQSKPSRRKEGCLGNFGTIALIPITHKGQLIGMIHIADPLKGKISRQRLVFLEQIASTIGASLKEITSEVELRKNNELLEKFFGTMNIQLAYLDKNMNFIRVNQAYAHSDNHDPDYYVGKNHFELFPNKENQEIFENVLKTGTPFSAYAKPFSYVHNPERGISYWDWTLQRVNDENGDPAGLLICLVDVTERHRTEERLLESYKHLGIINRKVAILLDLNKLRGGKGVDDIIQFIVNSALKLSQAKSVSFYEYRKSGDLLRLRYAAGNGAARKSKTPIQARQCPILHPLFKKKVRVQGAFTPEQMGCFNQPNASKYNLFLPLTVKSQLKGCMQFEFSKRTFITTQELDFYEAFATQASSALEKIKVFRDPQQLKLDFVHE